MVRFDHMIERVNRLEFYRVADFGPPGSDCHPCRVAQHVGCIDRCYAEISSLSLICGPQLRGVSLGPYDREERGQILGELFRSDAIVVSTSIGEEMLEVRNITSDRGEGGNDYAIDLEGIEGFKNALIRASAQGGEQFSMTIGDQVFIIPVNQSLRDGFQRFLRQCPD